MEYDTVTAVQTATGREMWLLLIITEQLLGYVCGWNFFYFCCFDANGITFGQVVYFWVN